ncbi:S41 family peptidase [Candidatus Chrysopegis kryptomonas]|uniref:Carboxyl-terminal processing protease n=1 Tax=Candidatus Chryseopegocella kryptomonas TaxID=1633643 RepID=A0A0P1MNZ8_9BACT|nr:S41 family peptidase [Candidatus Chrysopegis kryptomonas]CUS97125.1 carboxyl-terminal processing protease [Candidatus Chrysopegis kryptomonas]
MKRKILFFSFAFFVILAFFRIEFFQSRGDDLFFKMNKSFEILGKIYKEVILNYVDEVDPEKFMRAGIKGMLSELDPYTVFIDEKHSEEVDALTTGKYGGIGVSISKFDTAIFVIKVSKSYPADKAGIKVGDVIVQIDSVQVKDKSLDEVRTLMVGKPGTTIKLKILREGVGHPLVFELNREEVEVKNITYYDFIEDGIAYVKLERFSRNAGEELRKAIKNLQSKGQINGFILDLRDNPGGLLDAAVDVVEKFIPEGSLVVSTKGRKPDAVRNYYSTEKPLLPDVPLCVIVNNSSASASEIVAGAIQDLDRGIILGTRTFGKGLVQTISYLSYNTFLKMTTAKYYTPSGRCIQEIDYFHKPDGVFISKPDSEKKVFKTKLGRTVYAEGGITPDTVVESEKRSDFVEALVRNRMFFKFANLFSAKNQTLSDDFKITDQIFSEFKEFVMKNNFVFKDSFEINLEKAIEYAKKQKYSNGFVYDVELTLNRIKNQKIDYFKLYRDEIEKELMREILSRYKYEDEVIAWAIKYDEQVKSAVSILKEKKIYNSLLGLK